MKNIITHCWINFLTLAPNITRHIFIKNWNIILSSVICYLTGAVLINTHNITNGVIYLSLASGLSIYLMLAAHCETARKQGFQAHVIRIFEANHPIRSIIVFAGFTLLLLQTPEIISLYGGRIVDAGSYSLIALGKNLIFKPYLVLPLFILPIILVGWLSIWLGGKLTGRPVEFVAYLAESLRGCLLGYWVMIATFLIVGSVLFSLVNGPYQIQKGAFGIYKHISTIDALMNAVLHSLFAILAGIISAIIFRAWLELREPSLVTNPSDTEFGS